MKNHIKELTEMVAVNFADWISKNNWKFNAKSIKHPDYWIKFHGRGRGYTKGTTKNLYELFLKSEREKQPHFPILEAAKKKYEQEKKEKR